MHVFTLSTSPPCTELGSLSVAVSESVNVSAAQGRRVEETSAAGGSLPGLRLNQGSNKAVLSHLMANADSAEPDDDFFDMLVKCQVPAVEKDGNSLFEGPKSDCCCPSGLPFGRPALRSSPPSGERAHRTRRGLLQPHHALSGQADGRATRDPACPKHRSPIQLQLNQTPKGTALLKV